MLALRRLLCTLLVAVTLLLLTPMAVSAQVHEHQDENGAPMLRSLESLRDLDYQSWQAVAYRTGKPGNPVVLRIVGKGIISKTSEEIVLEDFPVCMPDAPSRTVGTQCALSLEQTRCSCVPLP